MSSDRMPRNDSRRAGRGRSTCGQPPSPERADGYGDRVMMRKTVVTSLAATVLVAGLCGCAPDPFADPTPPPTPSAVVSGFASDEEAFAAAEATYRAYVDAGNARRAGDSSADPAQYLSGKLLAAEIKSYETFESAGIRLEGKIRLISFEVRSASRDQIDATACIDVTETRVFNSKDEDVTPRSRQDVLGLDLKLESTTSTGKWLITSSEPNEVSCD